MEFRVAGNTLTPALSRRERALSVQPAGPSCP